MLCSLLFDFGWAKNASSIVQSLTCKTTTSRVDGFDLAIAKTGGYIYSRALLAVISAIFHWIVFQSIGTPAPIALAIWVGLVSQFLPVVGTYLAGVLPILLAFLDSPIKALIVIIFIAMYQQLENFVLAPRVTARTLELHAAVAFGAAIAGGAVLGPIGAVLALPFAAMVQGFVSNWGNRYEIVDNPLVFVPSLQKTKSKNDDENCFSIDSCACFNRHSTNRNCVNTYSLVFVCSFRLW